MNCAAGYIDNENGKGSTPLNANVEYRGLRVRMTPRTFLALAAPLGLPVGERTAEGLEAFMRGGGKVGSPMLFFNIPSGWPKGDFRKQADIEGHEGRNRMIAFAAICGEEPVEVHLFPAGAGLRATHILPAWVEQMRSGMLSQSPGGKGRRKAVSGPLFEDRATARGTLAEVFMREATVDKIGPGARLRVRRWPTLDARANTQHESVKTVHRLRDGGPHAGLRIALIGTLQAGTKTPRLLYGTVQNGVLVEIRDSRVRYEVLGLA